MLVQTYLYLILSFVFSTNQAHATSCQVNPSEYAYHDDSVTRAESASANCRSYPPGNLPGGDHPEDFIHCDGTQLKLADSNFGREQYQTPNYYMWSAGSDGQLLFIFPTRVSLTTITLHYYSNSDRGLPRLRFYAVPDDFDVWDTPAIGTPHKDVTSVPPGGEPTGRRSVSINVSFNTTKVLLYKYSSSFQLAVSEVEFFNKCMQATTKEVTTISTTTISSSSTSSVQILPDTETIISDFTETLNNGTKMLSGQSNTAIIAIGLPTVLLLILLSVFIITAVVVIRNYRRRSAKQELDTDASYSTLNRGSGLQVQPQYIQQNSNELYDQIHLSPSTGQTEFIPKPQSENTNNPSHSSYPTQPDTGNSMTNASAESQISSPMATYAVIDKRNKKKANKNDTKHTIAEKYTPNVSSSKGVHAEEDNSTKRSQKSLDDMHTSDHQDRERVNNDQEGNPPHSVEELYTAVKKKSKGGSAPVDESVPQIAEDLYTAVMKKPKKNSANDEVVPPVPPHTVEELYTAVHKKPKGTTMEDEEEAPPIPPLTVEDTS